VLTLIYDKTTPISVYSMNLTGGDLLFLGLGAIIYTILLFVVEALKNKQSLNTALSG